MQAFLVLLSLFFAGFGLAQKKNDSPYFKVSDIRYSDKSKDGRHTSLDVYMPRKGSNSPVIVWVHGGVWSFGDKSDVQSKPDFFTANGLVFVSVNHRLSPEAQFPDHARDLADALAWVVKNIIHYSGDPSRIFIMGNASGAHLAAFVTVNNHMLKEAGVPPKAIRGVVLLDGIGLDIPAIMTDATDKARDWCVSTFGSSEQDWADASPVSYVRNGVSLPPYLILYSGTKSPVEKEVLSFSRKLTDAGLKNKVINYAKKNALSLNKELGREGDMVGQDVLNFIYECLKN